MINNFDELISSGIHIVEFNATWCGPCKQMGVILDELKDVDIIKVDTDINKKLVMQYRIMSIPTLIFFKDGKKYTEIVGLHSKEEIEEILNKMTEE